jgi:hypothetical protein
MGDGSALINIQTAIPSYQLKTTDYTLSSTDSTVEFSASFVVTASLPTAVGIVGKSFTINNSSPNYVFVSGSEMINDWTDVFLSQNNSMTIQSNGAQWRVI